MGSDVEVLDAATSPVAGHIVPRQDMRGGITIGTLLERARNRLGLSREQVAADLWISDADLDRYECGLTTPLPNLIERLAEYYGVHPERFDAEVPPAIEATDDLESGTLWLGWAAIDLTSWDGSNDNLLRHIAETIRLMRSLSESDPVTVRRTEILAISSILDLRDPLLVDRICAWFGVGVDAAEALIERLHEARGDAPVLGS